MVFGGGVQSHFHVKPKLSLAEVRLSLTFVGVLTTKFDPSIVSLAQANYIHEPC